MEPQPIIMWYNYATQTYDPCTGVPTTDAVARQYIPQHQYAQDVYRIHRDLGESIPQAMLAVLTIIVDAHDHA
jgi:hypothetical protein